MYPLNVLTTRRTPRASFLHKIRQFPETFEGDEGAFQGIQGAFRWLGHLFQSTFTH